MQVAATILEQLGGYGRLKTMINGRDFIDMGDGLKFRFSGSRKANTAIIELTPRDTYHVHLYKITNRGLDVREVADAEMTWDAMKEYIETNTQLRLSI